VLFKSFGLTQKLCALTACAFVALPFTASADATTYTFVHFAGTTVGPGSTDGVGAAARFTTPLAVASDSAGNIYVADSANHTIRKITPAGVVTTFAGTAGVAGSVDGTGSAARFVTPAGLALDSHGNLFVADSSDDTIRKITPDGVVTTFAGKANTSGSAAGTGAAATFTAPHGLVCDSSDNLFVADTGNDLIRKITPAGEVTLFAGQAGVAGASNNSGPTATFSSPTNIAIDKSNNLYVADSGNFEIRKIDTGAAVTLFAGSGLQGTLDGKAAIAEFLNPYGIAVDANNNVYVSDASAQTIRKIASTGDVTTVAGNIYTVGSHDGAGNAATFDIPLGICMDSSGNIYVADSSNDVIRKVAPDFSVSTFAGAVPTPAASVDGVGSAARFHSPVGLVRDSGGNLYVADYGNYTIRKITPDGSVSTFVGTAGTQGYADGKGTAATFGGVVGMALDSTGNLFVTDQLAHTIRKIDPTGVVTTIAGAAKFPGSRDGVGSFAYFDGPEGIAVDSAGNLFVADTLNDTIRKVSPGADKTDPTKTIWTVTTLAGSPGLTPTSGETGDGVGSNARFKSPTGLAIDSTNNLYVCDSGNSTIRKITSDGTVTTIAGTAGTAGTVDGVGLAAQFNSPQSLAVDKDGNLFIADAGSNAIRKITLPAGVVTTLTGTTPEDLDGVGTNAHFNYPTAVVVDDTNGKLYISDTVNNDIRVGLSKSNTVVVQSQPVSRYAITGYNVVFNVAAIGQFGLTYQWQSAPAGSSNFTNLADGAGFSGTTSNALSVLNPGVGSNGEQFRVVISDGSQVQTTSNAVTLSVSDVSGAVADTNPHLSNLSARANVSAGTNVEIAGFIIGGTGTKTVLIRANGPALQTQGLASGYLANPTLALHNTDSTQSLIASNDNWGDVPAEKANIQAAVTAAGAVAWSDGSKDAAIVATLPPGGYTAVVSSADASASGVALVEIFVVDKNNTASVLKNISARSSVGTGDNVQIAGFIISGSASSTKHVVIRASGPALTQYQVTNALADPQVTLHSSATGQPVLGTDDNWDAPTQRSAFQALGLDNWAVGSKDAAIITDLAPGGYTAVVSGVNSTTGVALVEVFDAN